MSTDSNAPAMDVAALQADIEAILRKGPFGARARKALRDAAKALTDLSTQVDQERAESLAAAGSESRIAREAQHREQKLLDRLTAAESSLSTARAEVWEEAAVKFKADALALDATPDSHILRQTIAAAFTDCAQYCKSRATQARGK